MAKPTVKVEVAWTDGPYVASPTWSDITTYVRSISTSRGRTDDWQNFDSGSATLVLDNRDRRFDPTYTAGPNYGNLQPRRQIRVTADAGTGGGYVALFRGYVDGWPVRLSDAGFDSTVTITAYETLGLIAQEQLPADWADDYILSLSPTHFWRLDDTINPADIPTTPATRTNLQLKDYGSAPANLVADLESTPTANYNSLAAGIVSRTVIWPNQARYVATDPIDYTSGAGSFWFVAPEANMTFFQQGNTGTRFLRLGYSATSNLIVGTFWAGTGIGLTGRYFTFDARFTAGTTHHIAFSWTGTYYADFTINILLDGVVVTPTFSNVGGQVQGANRFEFYGSQQQIAFWSGSTLSTTQLRTIYQLGNNVLTETTAARFSRIIAQTPLPAALYSCTASPAGTVGRLTVGGAFVNNELQLTNDSEGGELYTTKAGVLTMTNRTWYQSGNAATSQATFGSGGIPIQTEIDYAWNADNIRNTLDVSWSGDAVVTCSDSTSRSTYGVMQDSWTTALSTYTDAQTLGNLLVGFGKLPRLVISAVEVGQALSAANWNTALGLELLDRITVVVPEPVGSNLSQTQIIQQIEHDITPGDWRTRILGSARWSSVFTIGTSYLDGTDILG